MNAIIVAAGQGSRLWPVTQRMPKTLLPFEEGTILSRILLNLRSAGAERFTVVVGFKAEMISDYLRANDHLGLEVELVENSEWLRGNGVSVARARSAVRGSDGVLLSMSDHLVPPDALRALAAAPRGRNLLLTDSRIEEVYDLDDATKVLLEEDEIREIGKDLASFNAIDCGVFRIDSRFMDALDEEIREGRESISDGVRRLIRGPGFGSVSPTAPCSWIDIDTPEAYRHAIDCGDRFRGPAVPVADPEESTEPR